ncbi:hypothetical protein CTI12_AA028880 [Artemisia annua]|uniref:Uncharacterized protein n=1 Tax=Artemisia annua TaxID=35608 RepID=A0A2U1QHI1_ARTAN|nr:hypothetical protein CTI12_AA028880 [Artemisia annua]
MADGILIKGLSHDLLSLAMLSDQGDCRGDAVVRLVVEVLGGPRHASWKFFLVLLFTILLVGPSSATSRGFTTLKPDQQRQKHDASSNNPGLYFSMKPKGKPVPPSGPSKRHNSVPNN